MTLLGTHTVSELTDLMKSFDAQEKQLADDQASTTPKWIAADPAGEQAWVTDYMTWLTKYGPASAKAHALINGTPDFMKDLTGAESEYNDVSIAFKPVTDLWRRLGDAKLKFLGMTAAQLQAQGQAMAANLPQPTALDADLGAFKATDSAARAMPASVKGLVGAIAPGLAPQTADSAEYGPMSTTTKVLIGLGVALGLGIVIKVAK